MKRRSFLFTGGLAAAPAAPQSPRAPGKNLLMHVGGDYHSVAGPGITSKENLDFNLAYGVKHLTVQLRNRWDVDDLRRMRDDCDRRGVTLEAIRMDAGYIALPNGADGD